MLLLTVVVVAVVLGWLDGGTLRRAGQTRLRGEVLFPVVVLAHLGVYRLPLPPGIAYWAWIVSFVAFIALALANRRLPGLPLIALGVALNLVVVFANRGMPVSAEAIRVVGGTLSALAASPVTHHLLTRATRIALLGDLIPVSSWGPLRAIVSVGDLVMFAGLAIAVMGAMGEQCPGTTPMRSIRTMREVKRHRDLASEASRVDPFEQGPTGPD